MFLWPFREFVVDICYLPRVSPVASVVSYDWSSTGQVILKDAVNVSGSLITTGWSRGHSYKNFEGVLVIAWKWRAESPISRPLSLLYSNAIHPLESLDRFQWNTGCVIFFWHVYPNGLGIQMWNIFCLTHTLTLLPTFRHVDLRTSSCCASEHLLFLKNS